MIGIIHYGLGNVFAFRNLYERLNIPVILVESKTDLEQTDKLILPGVGAFDDAMERFDTSGLRPYVEEAVLEKKRPVLGVCVGMQMLTESSEEGRRPGLSWLPATVRRFDGNAVALPHMGWNDVQPDIEAALFEGMRDDARFYFLHSYYVDCRDRGDVMAEANYGGNFCCAVNRDNIFGVQFHPEKSHHWGTRLLKNFAEL